jgi:tRNA threonylcarbamoyladenosine biosynthesis protein TsaB
MPPEPAAIAASSPPTLLAFELATEACSVALLHGGELLARHALAPRRHAELALPWAEALLAEAGVAKSRIDALAVGIGPGAFTGVRLALSLVQGIALGLGRPVLPVSTLAALAGPFLADGPVLAAIDARMGELYLGEYVADAEGLPLASAPECLLPAGEAAAVLRARWSARADPSGGSDGSRFRVVGSGAAAAGGGWLPPLADWLAGTEPEALPTAAAVARIARRDFLAGRAFAPERLEPRYLRDKVALTAAEQAAARAARDS